VRRTDPGVTPGRGRPAERWQVNPALIGDASRVAG